MLDYALIHLFLNHAIQIKDLISISAESYSRDQMLLMVRGQMLVMVCYCKLPNTSSLKLSFFAKEILDVLDRKLALRILFSPLLVAGLGM